jgi:hypothetical protein
LHVRAITAVIVVVAFVIITVEVDVDRMLRERYCPEDTLWGDSRIEVMHLIGAIRGHRPLKDV